jgi:hypothetical protein
MRINRGFLGWGLFLIIVGAIPLTVRGGLITQDQVRGAWNLWPLVLVGIGVAILLSRTRWAFLGGLLVSATFGVIVGGVLAGGVGGVCRPGGSGMQAFERRDGTLPGPAASIDLELSCGDLTLAVGAGNAWSVDGETRDGTAPDVDTDDGSLQVRSREGAEWFEGFDDRETWRVSLPEDIELDIAMELSAGSATIDLGQASVDALDVTLNAGSVTLDMGDVSEVGELVIELNAGALDLTVPNQTFDGSIEVNAGSVNLCAPPGAALRLHTTQSVVTGYDYDGEGLVKNGSTWETPGFDTAQTRIELDTRANAGSFTLNPEDGCGG